MDKIKYLKVITTILLFLFLAINFEIVAQCPMCKAAAEQNLANGGTAAKGLNKGILYLLATPYLLAISIGGFWWYKNHRTSNT